MFDYNEDKRGYLVTKMIFMAAVNSSTTTTTHIPAENLHDPKDLQKKIFFSILATLTTCYGTTTMNQMR